MPGYLDVNHLGEDWQAPDDEVQSAVATSLAATMGRFAERQAEAHTFLTEYGAAVVDGHDPNVVVPPFLEG